MKILILILALALTGLAPAAPAWHAPDTESRKGSAGTGLHIPKTTNRSLSS